MKKLWITLLLSLCFISGCSIIRVSVKVIDKEDFNLKIKDNKNYYYLYIDTIAYHYKVENTFSENFDHFYSRKISHNNKIGFIDIIDTNDHYFVVMMYNYAKVEAYVKKSDFKKAMINMCQILSSIKYNDNIINGYVGNDKTVVQEERFNIFDANMENDNFLKYESEYGTYKEKIDVSKDNDIVDVEETIE